MVLTKYYIRVINVEENQDSLKRGRESIRQIVEAFEEASLGRNSGLHPRGGYSLFINCKKSDLEAIIQTLVASGYCLCI